MMMKSSMMIILMGCLAAITAGIPLDAVIKKTPSKPLDSPDAAPPEAVPDPGSFENAAPPEAVPDPGDVETPDVEINEVKPNKNVEKNANGIVGSLVPKKIKTAIDKSVNPVKVDAILGKSAGQKLKAKISYFDFDTDTPSNAVNKIAPKMPKKIIDLSDIDEVLSDKLKQKYDEYLKRGFAKNIDDLKNIRRKYKILRKITGGAATDADDNLLFQGDEKLHESQLDSIIESTARHYGVDVDSLGLSASSRSKRQAIRAPSATPVDRTWPKTSSIKYYYDANITTETRNIIKAAFANIQNQTCLSFAESSTAVPRIHFVNWGTQCSSYVGYYPPSATWNGIHEIEVAPCVTNYGTLSHEILHSLGLYHQQARSDRDSYLDNVVGESILDGTNSENYGSPYDYGSVMHYNGFQTTQPLYLQTTGHRNGPSFIDIAVINQRYGCFCASPTVTCVNGGYPNPKNCDTCICPHGFGSRTCSGIDPGTEGTSQILEDLTSECKTLEKSVGTQNDVLYNFYQKSWVQFKAPTGKKVQIILVKAADALQSYSDGCNTNGVELKMSNTRFNRTGFVFCGNNNKFISASNDAIKTFTSTSNIAMLKLYTKKNKIDVVVRYRYVDSENDEIPSSCAPIPTGDPSCVNIQTDANCAYWNSLPTENCQADPTYMNKNCAKTCNACVTCANIQTDTNCAYWNSLPTENCVADPTYMNKNCAKTCNACKPCANIQSDANCAHWNTIPAENCQNDPTYMNKNCAKTCGTC